MKIADVIKFIKETNGKFFSIKFEKRSTGEIREMVARTGVTSHLVAVPSKHGGRFQAAQPNDPAGKGKAMNNQVIYVCLNCGWTAVFPDPWYAKPNHTCACRNGNGLCHNQFQVIQIGATQ